MAGSIAMDTRKSECRRKPDTSRGCEWRVGLELVLDFFLGADSFIGNVAGAAFYAVVNAEMTG